MSRRVWLVAACVAAFAVAGALVAGMVASSQSQAKQAGFVKAIADPDTQADKAGIANEGPEATWEAQQEALRAYPAESIPLAATLNAQATFNYFKKHGKKVGQWTSIGPEKAQYPAVLDQFLGDGAAYVASGRTTAMAIAPSCTKNQCRLYIGAAGGGIWTTDKALNANDPHWRFASAGFLTNAIGSMLMDPSDPSGDTVYVGTGESHASGDSEAGMGIYKTTDGGQTWSRVAGSNLFEGRSISSLVLDKDGNLLVGVARGVRGVSSVTGGATSNPPVAAAFGLYRQTGATFTLIWNGNGSIRGVNEVAVDPNTSTVVYAAAYQQGVWRSLDNGATWTQIKTPLNPGLSTDRAEFAVTKLAGGKTRMYIGDGAQGDIFNNDVPPVQIAFAARFYRTDDAAGAATFTDLTTPQNIDYCTAQCWYDNYVVSPAGSPDVVYLGGSFSYGQLHAQSNGRGILLSTDSGTTFSDLTQDGDRNHAEALHPDHHALVTVPGSPLEFISASDGGVVRSDGKFADTSYKCDSRGLNAADTAFCKSLLSRVPNQLIPMNKNLPTLQFQSFSVSAKNSHLLMGGTQDNGTFEFNGGREEWPQIIYGDGGQSGFNAADDRLRFNSFFGQNHDANFRDGKETKWVIISGKIAGSPEGSNFYAPIIADPNPAMAGSIFEGSQSVWRTQDWGGDRDFLEANCPEFTTSGTNPNCGDFVRIGPAGATDLTSTAYGADRAGAFVASVERARSNTGTMWAATNRGRVFITDNANAADPATVAWTRLDSSAANDPGRFVSSIYIDPANANHAWISYSGYNLNTPEPGHVFEVTRTGAAAVWVDKTLNLADLPVTDLVRDDVTGDLYAATDFGVWTLPSGGAAWSLTGGLPMVEVAGLTIVPQARVLYAATHGLGGWSFGLQK